MLKPVCTKDHTDLGPQAMHQFGKDCNWKCVQQPAMNSASDEDLERMLHEETERVNTLERFLRKLQTSTSARANTLLAELRLEASVDELLVQQ